MPLQLHSPDPDEDVEIARELAATIDGAELFLYPGADHLFVDRSLAGYDEDAAALVTRRVLDFLRLGRLLDVEPFLHPARRVPDLTLGDVAEPVRRG